MSVGGGHEAAVTARTRYGWAKFGECSVLSCGKRFPPRRKLTVIKSYVMAAILCMNE